MANDAGFRMPKDGLRELRGYVRVLMQGDLKKIHSAAAYNVARAARRMVQQAYQQSQYEHTESTKATYQLGKLAGATDARRRWPSAKSLVRSGQLSNSVIVRRTSAGYNVQIDPDKTYTSGDATDAGKRVQQIAAQMEDPQPISVTVTHAMLAYLHMLSAKKEGDQPVSAKKEGDQPGSGGLVVGSTLVIQMQPKKIWEPVYRKLGRLRALYFRTFYRYLKITKGARNFTGFSIDIGAGTTVEGE
jgi:hypothetical protein